jgi:hypothetical protein
MRTLPGDNGTNSSLSSLKVLKILSAMESDSHLTDRTGICKPNCAQKLDKTGEKA